VSRVRGQKSEVRDQTSVMGHRSDLSGYGKNQEVPVKNKIRSQGPARAPTLRGSVFVLPFGVAKDRRAKGKGRDFGARPT
jgi:hypothetical protein